MMSKTNSKVSTKLFHNGFTIKMFFHFICHNRKTNISPNIFFILVVYHVINVYHGSERHGERGSTEKGEMSSMTIRERKREELKEKGLKRREKMI